MKTFAGSSRVVCLILASAAVMLFGNRARSTEGVTEIRGRSVVHVYPDPLKSSDKLLDGPSGKAIEITGDTTLMWIDRMPDARYAHDTEYVLISSRDTRVIKGQWWPMLNGKEILRGEPATKVSFPIEVAEK